MNSLFRTKTGREFPGVGSGDLAGIRERLFGAYGIRPLQLVESSSFSSAMVVRYALGLSAEGGASLCLFDRSLSGAVALATCRHLWNAGCAVRLYEIGSGAGAFVDEVDAQLVALRALGAPYGTLDDTAALSRFGGELAQAHNALCGVSTPAVCSAPLTLRLLEQLNESRTPVHAIELPPGVDADTGRPVHGHPLYASSTLSLGAPLHGAFFGHDYIGRHYLCDNSIPAALYQPVAPKVNLLFSEQPVIQIFPVGAPGEDEAA